MRDDGREEGGGRKYDGRNGIRCSNKGDSSQRRSPVILSKAKNPVKEISKIRKFLELVASVAMYPQDGEGGGGSLHCEGHLISS